MIDVLWEGREVVMFAVDLADRAREIKDKTAASG